MEYQSMSKIDRLPTVKEKTGNRATATVYAHIHDGLFPKQVRIGQRSVGWPSHEVDAVVNARIAGCTDAEIKELVKQLHADRKGLMQQPTTPTVTDPSAPR